MLSEVVEGKTYETRTGELYKVVGIAIAGDLPAGRVVIYQNLKPTVLYPAFTPHALGLRKFKRSFNEVKIND